MVLFMHAYTTLRRVVACVYVMAYVYGALVPTVQCTVQGAAGLVKRLAVEHCRTYILRIAAGVC